MKNLDRRRLCHAMSWLAMTRLHDVLKLTAGFAVFFFFLFLWMGTAHAADQDSLMIYNASALGTLFTVCGFVLMFSGSFITNDMRTNQGRINVLMLPVSNLEKFVSRCVFVLVSSLASLFAAVVAADVCQMLFRLVSGGGWVSMTWLALLSLKNTAASLYTDYGWAFGMTMLLMFFVTHSFYVLGGTFFRRNQWILTTGVSFVLFNVLGWSLAMMLPYANFDFLSFPSWLRRFSESYPEQFAYVAFALFNIIQLALTALFYGLAYRLFCRIQLKNNKWTNL